MEKLSAEQRREQILEDLRKSGKVRVNDLSRQFGISEVSIRKDLELLESLGQLNRTHGGAVSPDTPYANMNTNERYNTNTELKHELAQRAAALIEDNDTVFMNAGTTLTYILRNLRGRHNVSIVTNSILNANELNRYPAFNVTLLGGQIDNRYQFTFGSDAIRQLENYHANKCILSVDGISATSGLSLYYSNEVGVIRMMMQSSDRVIVAADATKIGKNTFTRIASAEEVDLLVTNKSNRIEELKALQEAGITVIEA